MCLFSAVIGGVWSGLVSVPPPPTTSVAELADVVDEAVLQGLLRR